MSYTDNPQVQTMIDNMPDKTGKPLEGWLALLRESGLDKHGQIVKLLKSQHGVSHGFANTISHIYRQKAAGGAPSESDLVAAQYEGAKASLRPIYNAVLDAVKPFGSDVEIAPKKTYVSLRRSKQFAIIKPSTRTRVDLGFNLKDVESTERLEGGKVFSGMCTHLVRLTDAAQVDDEVIAWLKAAYDQA